MGWGTFLNSRVRELGPDFIELPGMVLDRETIEAFAKRLKLYDENDHLRFRLQTLDPEPREETLPDLDLSDQSPADLERLLLLSDRVQISFRKNQQVSVIGLNAEERSAVSYLLANGTPRLRWRRSYRYLPWLPVGLLIIGLLWPIFSVGSASWFHLLAVVGILAIATMAAWQTSSRIKAKDLYGWSGIRVRGESRAATAARRADSWANVKVVLITAPVTALLTAAAVLLLGAY